MGDIFPIITSSTRGVDGTSDPRLLGFRKLRHAVNLMFQNGRLMTRPVFDYMKLGVTGQFQGTTLFKPSLGLSFRPFASCGSRLATAVGGRIFVNNAPETGVECPPMELVNPDLPTLCSQEVDDLCSGDIHLYQAENLLVVQSLRRNTMWWAGEGKTLTVSPGMISENDQDPDGHSHSTMIDANHRNWLINGAGLGVYWNARIHQQGPFGIFVSDQLHVRGSQEAGDIVLMEEQSTQDSLSTNSKMGALLALEGVPQMGTANGEGTLIGYYDGGIVEYNTFQFPRTSEFDADGKLLVAGWDQKQMVKHNCNVISATGRYAVGVTPRDHFFRSGFGIHVLSRVLGVEFINDEPVNVLSDDVGNVLNADDPALLHGAAAGCWLHGHRWFMSTGFESLKTHSSSPIAKGFVSWNKVWGKTEDNTPLPAWEGVWVVDHQFQGIHRFTHTGMREDRGCFGFVGSDVDRRLFYAALRMDSAYDLREGRRIPVPWAFETGRFDFNETTRTKVLVEGRFEGVFRHSGTVVTVYVRTDKKPAWKEWRMFNACEKELQPGERLAVSRPLGKPPLEWQEATWFEFRVEGTGAAEITGFEVEVSKGTGKMEGAQCRTINDCVNVHPLTVAL